ncbi:carboxypeptidase-like regulatory domain-containing protein [Flavivirga spongiicola]|uniref:Carboxypeptidase-like regulatory domain-containing protein n=1 Tax=Flavivirga spongiicola TaxID=421621 RepID=A0ABU7XZC7_9FLAO|nr:carboxypeptidase-like regulatory domain-containing protein [Flavivirga sp. MEBiC05379]MDO5981146.1 carboxypeptidase-like regulatory domain-containing protein [Flavivirga sp. MEBiC05379]
MKKLALLTVLLLIGINIHSQNITAKLVDKSNDAPIPYATIKTGEFSGVISNEEGYFSLSLEDLQTKTITISCMGYQNKTLSIKAIKGFNFVVPLEAAINQLNEVYISNKRPNADSIIARTKAKLGENYDINLNKYNIFYRGTEYANFKSLDFEIEKASHVKSKNLEKANKSLDSLSKHIISSNIIHFSDFKGELSSLNKDSTKLVVNKATKLIDHKNDFSIDAVQEKAQTLVLKYLDTTKTYKVKTGLFKVEDSLSLKDEDFKDDEKNEYEVSHLKSTTGSLLRKSMFVDNSFLKTILDSKLYDYTFEDVGYNNGDLTYIISFKPRKGKAKFTGKLFISDENYAITKVDYKYYGSRHGKKVNLKFLLGIKFIENVSEGTYIYEKNSANKYQPKYIKRIKGAYFYVNRDLKLIENSHEKNKVGFSFKIEGDNRNKEEILFTDINHITLEDFASIKQEKVAPFTMLKAFEKTMWQNEETLEPLEEMKRFGSGE